MPSVNSCSYLYVLEGCFNDIELFHLNAHLVLKELRDKLVGDEGPSPPFLVLIFVLDSPLRYLPNLVVSQLEFVVGVFNLLNPRLKILQMLIPFLSLFLDLSAEDL